ncbi:HNH endonuclease [Bacteroides fragilis]|uniref:HNH endonuclease signature motif containing protein n=1 Tax=Bacteroides fragilis TaxID=817 RepID=UPI003312FE8B|nr:HNH endonuclease [Bacteroides fragilis]MCM0206846.1 HNH endonuclease [Bacteroides fragilis]MCM0276872.1 HNH endonuclease [Bacteroides fragilis]MCM0330866.1 HNH endonuclease [Bacteroides fragilis]MCM0374580.1 HNH endonuclease [Bacteroides fragilis]
MEAITRTDERGRTLYVQVFNGKEYKLYAGERYFSRGTKRLHREVWKFYNGQIPKGYHVHHKDENTWNNDISNLELVEMHAHLRHHAEEQSRDNELLAWRRENIAKASKFAVGWHKSEEGRKWHSKKAKEQFANAKPETFICEWCGKEFSAISNGNNKFCSNKCKTAYRYHSGTDNEKRKCKWCGNEFVANKYSKTEFCCRRCSGQSSASVRAERDRDSKGRYM